MKGGTTFNFTDQKFDTDIGKICVPMHHFMLRSACGSTPPQSEYPPTPIKATFKMTENSSSSQFKLT